jgi:hypothetical protein
MSPACWAYNAATAAYSQRPAATVFFLTLQNLRVARCGWRVRYGCGVSLALSGVADRDGAMDFGLCCAGAASDSDERSYARELRLIGAMYVLSTLPPTTHVCKYL